MKADELYKSIGGIIRLKRNGRGLTLEQLAEKIGRDWSYLSQIERGMAVPSIETLTRLAEALNLPMSDLFKVHKPKESYKIDPLMNKIVNAMRDRDSKEKKAVLNIIYHIYRRK